MSDEWPNAGTLLAARYRLVTLLETGGMSTIWRADDELLGRPVAVKLPLGAQVVWREARMAAKLQHPNIAAVHDYREAVRPDGTVAPFVVMELLAGESVAARLEREPIELPEAARIGAAVADALAAAHANGVVHRDIKPGNVMLTPNGIKILDFGISATAGEPDDDDTGSTFGTPAYVAPERLDGMPAEPATDVYGLGVLLFEMVTGDPPYPVDTWEELAAARAEGPRVLPAELPAAFRDIVGRCLAELPEDRPGADEIRFDLTALWLKPESAVNRPSGAHPMNGTGGHLAGPARPPAGPGGSRPRGTHGPGGSRPTGSRTPSVRVEANVGARGASSPRATFPELPPRAGDAAFKPGRAAPATVPLTPAPTRRWVLGAVVVALFAAAGGALIAINWPREGNESAAPGNPPPAVVVSPSVAPLSTPATSAPAAPTFSPTPAAPTPTLDFDDAVSRFRSTVEDAGIRSDLQTDLLNFVRPLENADAGNVDKRIDDLRRKINDRAGEGSLSRAQASLLRSRLADIKTAAGM
ncbi:serine/threonine-protein kinase [Paractinoplanes abujensis]|uniref:non-specific serine/threonine protein kinase n=1 Tax=Paractinoplanes abujensis TaxID=882441 RepID=A0A7W7CNU4_9ACTN|nr:serine/threonine-protein kinase [Actinoplanes abujensis]MBB4690201.1 serine/threonine-protein kinase [Actinoplanes abujensis]